MTPEPKAQQLVRPNISVVFTVQQTDETYVLLIH